MGFSAYMGAANSALNIRTARYPSSQRGVPASLGGRRGVVARNLPRHHRRDGCLVVRRARVARAQQNGPRVVDAGIPEVYLEKILGTLTNAENLLCVLFTSRTFPQCLAHSHLRAEHLKVSETFLCASTRV